MRPRCQVGPSRRSIARIRLIEVPRQMNQDPRGLAGASYIARRLDNCPPCESTSLAAGLYAVESVYAY